MENITHSIAKKNYYTPTQLKNLVQAAQRYEQHAIDKLCEDFKPLIYKEARQANVYAALGEDAINIAWEIFLSFIYKYKGNNFRLLPGLAQKHVHYRLLDSLHQQGCLLDCDALDAEESSSNTIADKNDYIADCDTKLTLEYAISKLGAKQKLLVNELFMNDNSLQGCSKKYGLTKQSCHVYKKRALNALKKYLSA